MKFIHVLGLAIVAATWGLGAANAQAMRDHRGQAGGVFASIHAVGGDPCTTRVVLRRIAESQAIAARGVYIPSGYKKVWEDDRLSLRRTQQTFAGQAQMERLWTNTVPRNQIGQGIGNVMVRHSGPVNRDSSYAVQCGGR